MSDERGAGGSPWSVRFRREREAAWLELEELVVQCERRGLRRLGPNRLARLPVLYRAAVSSLAVARASVLDRGLNAYLEALVARAYVCVYAPRRTVTAVAVEFAAARFPAAVRGIGWHVLAATATMLLGAGIAAALYAGDPDTYWYFVPAAMASGRDPGATTEFLRATLFGGEDGELLTFAAFLFTHNATVAILTYGLGFLFGVPALLLLLYTGLMLGAMTALYCDRGLGAEWFSWILPHGITELGAICLAGGAALALAQALVLPGRAARLDRLADVGRAMGAVLAGAVAMLLLAGMIEGVFRQTVQSLPVRYALAAITLLCWSLYFGLCGRFRR
ncbi:MAG: stage II sporulation protein M [Planctomycetota bacterium]